MIAILHRKLPVQCPACRDHLGAGPVVTTCPTCATAHHETCLAELGCSSLNCNVGGTRVGGNALAHETEPVHPRFARVFEYLWNNGSPLIEGLDCGRVAGSSRFVVLGDWNNPTACLPYQGPTQRRPLANRDGFEWSREDRWPRWLTYECHSNAPCYATQYETDTTPARAAALFERMGVDQEWSDGFSRCDCGALICTEVSHGEPDYWVGDGEILCCECVASEALPCCGLPDRAQCDGEAGSPCDYQEEGRECHCACNAEPVAPECAYCEDDATLEDSDGDPCCAAHADE